MEFLWILAVVTVVLAMSAAGFTAWVLKGWWRVVVLAPAAASLTSVLIFAPDVQSGLVSQLGWVGYIFVPAWSLILPATFIIWIYGKERYPYGLLQHRRPTAAERPVDE